MSRILIVDDQDEFRRMLNRMLSQEGYEVIEAANGRIALEKYSEMKFDLVITDLFMPEKDGFETIMELKRINSDAKIIGISGGGQTKDISLLGSMKAFGASSVLEKPFEKEVLLTEIQNLLAE